MEKRPLKWIRELELNWSGNESDDSAWGEEEELTKDCEKTCFLRLRRRGILMTWSEKVGGGGSREISFLKFCGNPLLNESLAASQWSSGRKYCSTETIIIL